MKTPVRIATLPVLAAAGTLCAASLLATPATASPVPSSRTTGHEPTQRHDRASDPAGAVFVQTDNLAGNAVVAYQRSSDGTLTQAGIYPTGGLGGQLSGSVVDHTASQGALTYDAAHHLLYAVNAGSNTITVFAVHGARLMRLQTIGSGGEFPVSITVRRGLLYVLNARGGGSIQGYLRFGGFLIKVPAWHRNLGFDPNPASEFTSTPGQIAFSPEGSKLIVTTKGDGQSIEVFPLGPFGTPSAPVVTPDPGNVPFAIAFDQRGRAVIAEAGPSALVTYKINQDATLTFVSRTTTGQAATCWVTTTGRHVYASNAGSATVSSYADRHGILTGGTTTGTDPGTVDSSASPDGRFLYVQAGGIGSVDEYKIGHDGALTEIGSVTVPDAVGGEGIAAS